MESHRGTESLTVAVSDNSKGYPYSEGLLILLVHYLQRRPIIHNPDVVHYQGMIALIITILIRQLCI